MRILVFSLAILAKMVYLSMGATGQIAARNVHKLWQFAYAEQIELHLIHFRHVLQTKYVWQCECGWYAK